MILVTNDDGVEAKGIKALIEAVRGFGNVVVVAPEKGMSGMAHAVTVSTPLSITKVVDAKGLEIYKSNGTPADCVKLAMNVILDRNPDFIVSGINHGTNSSVSVHYSGTIGAAREGALNGITSIGYSLLDYDEDADFSTAIHFARLVLGAIISQDPMPGLYYNVNIPKGNDVKGIKICRQANGKWIEEFDERVDPRGRRYFWLTGSFQNSEPESTETDEWALANGFVSVVPCTVDATHHNSIDLIKGLRLVNDISRQIVINQ